MKVKVFKTVAFSTLVLASASAIASPSTQRSEIKETISKTLSEKYESQEIEKKSREIINTPLGKVDFSLTDELLNFLFNDITVMDTQPGCEQG